MANIVTDQYKEMGDVKYYGVQSLGNPILMVCDPEVVKEINVKAFNHFVDRVGPNTNKLFSG